MKKSAKRKTAYISFYIDCLIKHFPLIFQAPFQIAPVVSSTFTTVTYYFFQDFFLEYRYQTILTFFHISK